MSHTQSDYKVFYDQIMFALNNKSLFKTFLRLHSNE
jgi:hypothetical protein